MKKQTKPLLQRAICPLAFLKPLETTLITPLRFGLPTLLIKAGLDVDGIFRSVERGAIVPTGKPIPWKIRLPNVVSSLKKRGT